MDIEELVERLWNCGLTRATAERICRQYEKRGNLDELEEFIRLSEACQIKTTYSDNY